MRKTVLALSLAAFPAVLLAAGELWHNGKTEWSIVSDEKAAAPVVFAVEELKSALDACSGADFRVANAVSSKPTILVGAATDTLVKPYADKLGLDPKSADEQVAVSLVRRGLVVIAGNDAMAALHGAYMFLNRVVGVRHLWPGEDGTFYPKPKSFELPAKLGWRHVPKIRWRGYSLGGGVFRLKEYLVWMARNCMNASENIPRFGMRATVGGHNMHVENPEQNLVQHPEWFALMGGKRNVHFPCCRNPGAAESIIRRVMPEAALAKKCNALFLSLYVPDGSPECKCDLCKGHSVSDNQFYLEQKVADAVHRKYPDLPIAGLGYAGYMSAPSIPLHDVGFMRIASENKCPHCVIDEPGCPWNKYLLGVYDSWKKCAEKNGNFPRGEYGYEFLLYFRKGDVRFVPNFTLLEDSVKVAIRYGHTYIVPETVLEPSEGPMERVSQFANRLPSAYYAQVMFDETLTPEAFLRDVARTVWGPAEEQMVAYFKLLDKAWRSTGIHTVMWKPHPSSEASRFMTKRVHSDAHKLLDAAEAAIEGAPKDAAERYPTFDAARAKAALAYERALLQPWEVAAGLKYDDRAMKLPAQSAMSAPSVEPVHLLKAGGKPAKLAVRCGWSPSSKELIVVWDGVGRERLADGFHLEASLESKGSDGPRVFAFRNGKKEPAKKPEWKFVAGASSATMRIPLNAVDRTLTFGSELSGRFTAGVAEDSTDAAYPSFADDRAAMILVK